MCESFELDAPQTTPCTLYRLPVDGVVWASIPMSMFGPVSLSHDANATLLGLSTQLSFDCFHDIRRFDVGLSLTLLHVFIHGRLTLDCSPGLRLSLSRHLLLVSVWRCGALNFGVEMVFDACWCLFFP